MVDNVINFMYFLANFPHDFIGKCWSDNKILADHLKEKLLGYSDNRCYVTCEDMCKFFFELDKGNQNKLIQWVNENYLAFDNLNIK
jgi:hypothetical protein